MANFFPFESSRRFIASLCAQAGRWHCATLSVRAVAFVLLVSLVPFPVSATSEHNGVRKEKFGVGGLATWIFTPTVPPEPSVPVVLFLHGYRATDPYAYGGWIDHIVRQGRILLFPIFEESRRSPAIKSMENAIEATKRALRRLQLQGPVKPDTDRFAIVGHSFGGGLSAVIAAQAKAVALPVPKLVMAVQPGWQGSANEYPADKLTDMPSSVYLLVVEGDKDQFASSRVSRTILSRTRNVPRERKRLVMLHTDEGRGDSGLADHYAPLAPDEAYKLEELSRREERRKRIVSGIMGIRDGEISQLDREGFWKLFDSLEQAAYSGGRMDAVVGAVKGNNAVKLTVE